MLRVQVSHRFAGFRMAQPHLFPTHLSARSNSVSQPVLSPLRPAVSAEWSCPQGRMSQKMPAAVSSMQFRGSQWQSRPLHFEWRSGEDFFRRCERVSESWSWLDRTFAADTAGLGVRGARKATAVCASRNMLQDSGNTVESSREPSGEVQGEAIEPNLSTSTPKKWLKDMSFQDLQKWVSKDLSEDPKKAALLWTWLYRDNYWARNAADMEGVSIRFREKLEKKASFDSLVLDGVRTSKDGTRKITYRLADSEGQGEGVVETVLICHPDSQRHTICVSSQLGCAMNCHFCFTAKMGLHRHLSVAHMVDQVVLTRRLFQREVGSITNVVFMGMGEPMHNLDAVLTAVDTLVHPQGLHFSPAKVTVSTSGLLPQMRRFCQESSACLALSLNATTNEVRDWLMPVNRKYNIEALLAGLREEFPRRGGEGGVRGQERVFLEYIMLAGVNDRDEDVERLLELTEGLPCKLNLIMFNPHEGSDLEATPKEEVLEFRNKLIRGGRKVFIRASRGDDEMAACGQLGQPAPKRRGKRGEVMEFAAEG